MKRKTKKQDLVFSTGDDSLVTLGEELRRKFPDLVEKMEKFKTSSDQAVAKLVDTLWNYSRMNGVTGNSFLRE